MSFGPPGPLSSAMKALIGVNVALFVVKLFIPPLTLEQLLGLSPQHLFHDLRLWQPVTYMFVHGSPSHIVFNMLALWMFGSELERVWGTRYFVKFYFACGVGAGLLTAVFSFVPVDFAEAVYYSTVVGASGAIYGLLFAYALYFPDRPILLVLFWVPARVCVAILGAIALYMSLSEVGGVANATHLFGLLVGYLMLKTSRMHPWAEVKYRYLKWKINRVRKKFDVYSGGRADDWDRRVH